MSNEEIILAEAKQRYKEGDIVRSAYSNNTLTVESPREFRIYQPMNAISSGLNYIYYRGKWAKMIKPIKTLEQRFKEMEL
jgi:hypothetical protein